MGITGEGFCKSAWCGFLLNLKYLCKFFFAHKLANMFVSVGIFMCVLINLALTYALTTYVFKDSEDGTNMLLPWVIIAFYSVLIPMVSIGLFDESVTATLTCYAVDADLNGETPKFGPRSYHEKLRAIDELDKKEKEEKQEGGQAE